MILPTLIFSSLLVEVKSSPFISTSCSTGTSSVSTGLEGRLAGRAGRGRVGRSRRGAGVIRASSVGAGGPTAVSERCAMRAAK